MTALPKVLLLPGDFEVVQRPTHIGTVLGSCVAVCLSNPFRQLAAMNHFMLPNSDGCGDAGRYGDSSMRVVIERLLAIDRDPTHYRARVYGGAHVLKQLGESADIGGRNVAIARSALAQSGIRIVHEETGGMQGRRIDFFTADETVHCVGLGNTPTVASAKSPTDLRVLIVDGSKLARRVLRSALSGSPGVHVAGVASTPTEAQGQLWMAKADVVTVDPDMPGVDGPAFVKELVDRGRAVVVVSAGARLGTPSRGQALAAGALEVVDKDGLQLFRGMRGTQRMLVPALHRAAAHAEAGKMGHRRTG